MRGTVVGDVLRGERVDSRFIRDSKEHGRNCIEDAMFVEGECLMCNLLLSFFYDTG